MNEIPINQVRALDLGSCSSALHSEDTKGYVIPPGQPGKKDRNIENEKTNFFVGVPKLCGLNTDANPHIQNQKHCAAVAYGSIGHNRIPCPLG
eukprot:scaffold4015_cov200-Skeletonema_marinoi.AAC.23